MGKIITTKCLKCGRIIEHLKFFNQKGICSCCMTTSELIESINNILISKELRTNFYKQKKITIQINLNGV